MRCLSKCQSRKNANKLQRPGIRLCRSGNDTDVADLHVTSASVADEATVIRDVYEEPQTQAWGSRRDKKGRFLLTSKAISLALMGYYRGIVALLITGITYKKTLPIAVSRCYHVRCHWRVYSLQVTQPCTGPPAPHQITSWHQAPRQN